MTQISAFFFSVILHFIFDFVFQGSQIGLHKYRLNKFMLTHGLILSTAAAFPVWVYSRSIMYSFLAFIWILISHLTIDIVRVELNRKYTKGPSTSLFWKLLGLDQILHVSALFLVFRLI